MVYRHTRYALIVVSIFVLSGVVVASNSTEGEVFSTWNVFEADKCASIWLIQRFIAPNAEIRFYSHGEPITQGIPFDTPEARFRRYHNRATFTTLVTHYQLNDPQIVTIDRIIHDIEINLWEKKVMAETGRVMSELQVLFEQKDTPRLVQQGCLEYFDELYAHLRRSQGGSDEK